MRWMLATIFGLMFIGLAFCTRTRQEDEEPVLSYEFPHEVELAQKAPQQMDFDVFSWKSFVALNWPANADGTPNTNVKIGQEAKAKRVWEFYMDPDDVFLPDGSEPTWKSPEDIGAGLHMIKGAGQVRLSNLDALHFPVVDQDKNFVVFGIRMNKDEFDYIVANGLYNKKGQMGPSPLAEKFISFPSGAKDGAVGAVEIKTAWRLFPPEPKPDPEIMKRYFTTEAVLTIPKENSVTGNELKIPTTLGLVAVHIAHKTKAFPQWVWSTFEHVDNLTDVPPEPEKPDVAPIKPYLWAETAPFASPNQRIPVQVKRKTDIPAETVKLNEAWQKKLRAVDEASVWQYYQLISTQWPTQPAARKPGERPTTAKQIRDYQGSPAPVLLANIPTEVYNQDTSSCIVCHSKAFTTRGDYADFSFLLQFAK